MAALLAGSCVGPRAGDPRPPVAVVRPIPPAPQQRVTLPPAPARFAFEGAFAQGGLVLGTAPIGTRGVRLDGEAIELAPDRRFVIAFDRDASPTARVEAELDDGRVITETLSIAPGGWRIENVNASPTGGASSAEFRRRRAGELAQIGAARAKVTGAQGWRQRFIWPVAGRQSGLFGAQRVYRGQPGSFHSGADVAAVTGTPVRAPADGVVVLAAAAPFTLEGNLLLIDHGMGVNSALLHLSRIDVREGQPVRQGEIVGAVGATGRASGPHMHWGLKWRAARIDPAKVAGPVPPR